MVLAATAVIETILHRVADRQTGGGSRSPCPSRLVGAVDTSHRAVSRWLFW